jgi:hypothetical protein
VEHQGQKHKEGQTRASIFLAAKTEQFESSSNSKAAAEATMPNQFVCLEMMLAGCMRQTSLCAIAGHQGCVQLSPPNALQADQGGYGSPGSSAPHRAVSFLDRTSEELHTPHEGALMAYDSSDSGSGDVAGADMLVVPRRPQPASFKSRSRAHDCMGIVFGNKRVGQSQTINEALSLGGEKSALPLETFEFGVDALAAGTSSGSKQLGLGRSPEIEPHDRDGEDEVSLEALGAGVDALAATEEHLVPSQQPPYHSSEVLDGSALFSEKHGQGVRLLLEPAHRDPPCSYGAAGAAMHLEVKGGTFDDHKRGFLKKPRKHPNACASSTRHTGILQESPKNALSSSVQQESALTWTPGGQVGKQQQRTGARILGHETGSDGFDTSLGSVITGKVHKTDKKSAAPGPLCAAKQHGKERPQQELSDDKAIASNTVVGPTCMEASWQRLLALAAGDEDDKRVDEAQPRRSRAAETLGEEQDNVAENVHEDSCGEKMWTSSAVLDVRGTSSSAARDSTVVEDPKNADELLQQLKRLERDVAAAQKEASTVAKRARKASRPPTPARCVLHLCSFREIMQLIVQLRRRFLGSVSSFCALVCT